MKGAPQPHAVDGKCLQFQFGPTITTRRHREPEPDEEAPQFTVNAGTGA